MSGKIVALFTPNMSNLRRIEEKAFAGILILPSFFLKRLLFSNSRRSPRLKFCGQNSVFLLEALSALSLVIAVVLGVAL
jgi:hypothetical protein